VKLTPEEELAKLALALREASPREWEAFNNGFSAYVSASSQNIYKSSADDLLRIQGFGQAMIYMRDLFKNAHVVVHKADERMRNERHAAAPRPHQAHP
jgi:hypothetical protein